MRLVAPLLALLAVLSSCLSRQPNYARSCSVTTYYTLDSSFTERERMAINDAMNAWQEGTGGRACFADGFGLHIYRLERQEDLAPHDLGWRGHIGLYSGSRIWVVAGAIDSRRYMASTVAHELGHWFGLKHQRGGCMETVVPDNCLGEGLPDADRKQWCEIHGCQ